MLTDSTINRLLGITESYQAPAKLLGIMLDDNKRPDLFAQFLDEEWRVDYEWFHEYFQNEHADKKVKKQDFTPNSVSHLLARISGQNKTYFESAAGTGGILIQAWNQHRFDAGPAKYDPRSYWYQVEELSDRSIPFLIFNMAIRGINGVILHGDSLEREFKNVYFIRNNTSDFLNFSEVIVMPKTNELMRELQIKQWA
jgi:type I restriction-modification system DNA methylase subunit